jgi:hypothetical protein
VDGERVRMVIEVEPGEPLTGRVGREGERQFPFEGMLGFLSLFERLRGEPAEAPDGPERLP